MKAHAHTTDDTSAGTDSSIFKVQEIFEKPKQPLTVQMDCDEYQKEDVKKLDMIEE